MTFDIRVGRSGSGGFLAVVDFMPGARAEAPFKNRAVRMAMSIALNVVAERILTQQAHPEDFPLGFNVVDDEKMAVRVPHPDGEPKE